MENNFQTINQNYNNTNPQYNNGYNGYNGNGYNQFATNSNMNINTNNGNFYADKDQEKKNIKKTIIIITIVFLILSLCCCCCCCVGLYILEANEDNTFINEDGSNHYEEIVGQTFYDNSGYVHEELHLNEDYSFLWQNEDSILDGTFEIYYDENAIDYIVENLEEYGLTRSEQEELIERNDNFDHYVCLILYPETLIVNGEEMSPSSRIPYVGFSLYENEEYYIDFANMNSFTYTTLCRK